MNKATRVMNNGIQYDSLTELNFHIRYSHTKRNLESFTVWKGAATGAAITYTPDFYDPKLGVYIEIKGYYKQFMEPGYQLKWKLIKEYFAANDMRIIALIPYQGDWLPTSQYVNLRHESMVKANSELKSIEKLIKRKKKLKPLEIESLIFLLTNPKSTWNSLKRGNMVAKKRLYMPLRAKLLKAKDKTKVLLNNI